MISHGSRVSLDFLLGGSESSLFQILRWLGFRSNTMWELQRTVIVLCMFVPLISCF
jgi:hypothetical protein